MGVVTAAIARVSVSDLLAVASVGCAIYGASLLHPAAPWLVGSLACGFVAIELGKREARRRGE